MLLTQQFPSYSISMVGHTALGAQDRVTQSHCLCYMVGRGILLQVVLNSVTWSTQNLWWALHLVILVWWFGIRFINLPIPGQ